MLAVTDWTKRSQVDIHQEVRAMARALIRNDYGPMQGDRDASHVLHSFKEALAEFSAGPERGLPFCPDCGEEYWTDDDSLYCPCEGRGVVASSDVFDLFDEVLDAIRSAEDPMEAAYNVMRVIKSSEHSSAEAEQQALADSESSQDHLSAPSAVSSTQKLEREIEDFRLWANQEVRQWPKWKRQEMRWALRRGGSTRQKPHVVTPEEAAEIGACPHHLWDLPCPDCVG